MERRVKCPKCGNDVYIHRNPIKKCWEGYYDEDIQTVEDVMFSDDDCEMYTPKVHECFELHEVDGPSPRFAAIDSPNIQKLFGMQCCCGDDHTIREGGERLNMVQTHYLAKWTYLAMTNVLVPESFKYPLATALICDRCKQQENIEIKYVIGGNEGEDGPEYFRVPVEELEKPAVFWPDLHPEILKGS